MMMTTSELYVIALHGGFLTPDDLARDIGCPSWVNWYTKQRDPSDIAAVVDGNAPILVGYSEGGSIIGEVSRICPGIAGAVLYESPLLRDIVPGGDFPVLWIRNDYRSTPRREREFADTLERWKANHPVTEMTGRGRHVRWRWGWPPVGHAWDQSLNPRIKAWVMTLQNNKTESSLMLTSKEASDGR